MGDTEGLHESEVDPDPVVQFGRWYADLPEGPDRSAATLATASAEGEPSARIVLLRGFDDRGFVFFTNHHSAKAADLAANPRAALVFSWPPARQVRLAGRVEHLTRDESLDYWRGRPRGAQLAAWASWQSEVIESREVLERRWAEFNDRFPAGEDVPLPDFWGGYRVIPEWMEFWHQREYRLHDRLRYRRTTDGAWAVERLSP
ncbi:MAG TPA: pyridoxamine 5'-phosphate oxidase [Acidimicrobiia bacterium]|nr:pyridoxamine 5'-phosphate oxidase [Acidimicrobiia bacterium]